MLWPFARRDQSFSNSSHDSQASQDYLGFPGCHGNPSRSSILLLTSKTLDQRQAYSEVAFSPDAAHISTTRTVGNGTPRLSATLCSRGGPHLVIHAAQPCQRDLLGSKTNADQYNGAAGHPSLLPRDVWDAENGTALRACICLSSQ